MTHPNCVHTCTSNCRREGCNCKCGEWHDTYEKSSGEKKVKAVSGLLQKYCDLKPEYDGKFASQLALQIINAINQVK